MMRAGHNQQRGNAEWELGLFAASVSSLTPAETIQLVAESEYQYIEWRVQTAEALAASPWGPANNTLVLERLSEEVGTILPQLNAKGLRICGLQVDVPATDPEVIAAIIGAACVMECPMIRIEAPPLDPARTYAEQYDAFQGVLDAWVRQARGNGILVCVETHFDTIAPSASLAAGLVRSFDPAAAGVMWDPANTLIEGSEREALALSQLGAHLAEVHIKNGFWYNDASEGWKFTWSNLDEGMIDWPRVLESLKSVGYAGPLVLEDYRPIDVADKLIGARDYVWSIMPPHP